jgi:hypothetical protein
MKTSKNGQPASLRSGRLVRPLSAQVLVFQPELTHSVWTDFMSRARTQEALEKQLRKGVRSGEYVGYRLHRIECEYLGITWPNIKITNEPPSADESIR